MAGKKDKSVKKLREDSGNIRQETLEGLMRLGNTDDIKHLYQAIRDIKYQILRDEFAVSTNDVYKHAIRKEWYKGGDYFLTILAQVIKKSPAMLDVIEEERENGSKRNSK